jgi:hypothetical protein
VKTGIFRVFFNGMPSHAAAGFFALFFDCFFGCFLMLGTMPRRPV